MLAPPEDAAPSRAPVRIGRYVVFNEFARGGQATVHLGRLVGPEGFSRLVAVKRLQPSLAESDEHARRLLEEARLTARIRHPNVVQTLDVVDEHGVLYVMMEYVHGVTLAQLLDAAEAAGELTPIDVAVGIVADALQGLRAAHDAKDEQGAPLGIIHRDVSPHNVQVGADGVARILDFGIAKSLRREQVTAPGEVKGKLAYMPREQLSGQPVTRQADLYAMGVVLWEAVTGKRLFDDPDPARLGVRVRTERAPPPSQQRSDVPPSLDAVVLRATSHDPRKRFATADEMLAALLDAAPRAEASAIASFLLGPAGDDLEMRAEHVRAVESFTLSDSAAAPSMASARPAGPLSLSPTASPASRMMRAVRRPWIRIAAPVAALLTIGAIVATATGARHEPAPALAAGAAAAAASSAVPNPAEGSSNAVPAAPLAFDPQAAESDSVDPDIVFELDDAPNDPTQPPPVKTSSATLTPASRTARPKRRTAAPRPANACDPPYSIDANGWKHYKPQCLP